MKIYRLLITIGLSIAISIWAPSLIAQGYLGKTDRIFVSGGMGSNLSGGYSAYIPSLNAGIDYVKTLNRNLEVGGYIRTISLGIEEFSVSYENSSGNQRYSSFDLAIKGGGAGVYLNSYLYKKFSSVAPIGMYFQVGASFNEWHVGEKINMFGKPTSLIGEQLTQFSFLLLHIGIGQHAVWGDKYSVGWVMRTGIPVTYFDEPRDLIPGIFISSDFYPIDESATSLFRYTVATLEISIGYLF